MQVLRRPPIAEGPTLQVETNRGQALGVSAAIEHGFVLTVVRYRSQNSTNAEPVEAPRAFPTAAAALRTMRVQIRGAHVLGMTPREITRAVEWAESGWRYALGLLASGHQCGFTVVLGSGAVAEWSVHPAPYVELRTSSHCASERACSRTELIS
ncbi:hypothetical protein ACFTWH_00375 [Streptomyces sp. NPDC057011]|uniref:hypothetical protein n=1 Tax=unclassified Streptomyces TaxID=2593676 RepID=UPI00363417E1